MKRNAIFIKNHAEWLKTILGKSQKLIELYPSAESPIPKINILSMLAKNDWKMELELFPQCPTLPPPISNTPLSNARPKLGEN